MRKLRTIEMNRLTLEEFKEAEKLPLIVVPMTICRPESFQVFSVPAMPSV